ncbi:MAG: amidohydrolase family protein, partial [Clostridia bacterium]|nr:amidohydrolase family protein [Clostridia bacterium]
VGAHLGGWSVWERTEELTELPNLYVDCSSCFPFRGAQAMLPIMKHYGAEKILFGTDYPMWSPVTEIKNFMSLPFTEEERELILFKNAKKVFRIN